MPMSCGKSFVASIEARLTDADEHTLAPPISLDASVNANRRLHILLTPGRRLACCSSSVLVPACSKLAPCHHLIMKISGRCTCQALTQHDPSPAASISFPPSPLPRRVNPTHRRLTKYPCTRRLELSKNSEQLSIPSAKAMMPVPMSIRLLRPALSTKTPETKVITTRQIPTETVAST